jgi:hypothetical protein
MECLIAFAKCPLLKTSNLKKVTSGYLAHELVLYFEWVYDYKLNYFSTTTICTPNGIVFKQK